MKLQMEVTTLPSSGAWRKTYRVLRKSVKVWNKFKTRKVKAYSIFPDKDYKLSIYTKSSGWPNEEQYFCIYNYYHNCTKAHERVSKPQLVMETPEESPKSRPVGALLGFTDVRDQITFRIEAKHLPCKACNTFWMYAVLVECLDNGDEEAVYEIEVPFVLKR